MTRTPLLMLVAAGCLAQPTHLQFHPQQIAVGQLRQYVVSICNQGDLTLTVYGLQIWNAAPSFGLLPATQTALLEELDRNRRMSAARWALLSLEGANYVAAGLTALSRRDPETGDIEGPVKIPARWAPAFLSVGIALRTITTVVQREAKPAEIPDRDRLLPPLFQLGPRPACADYVMYGIPYQRKDDATNSR